MLFNDGAACGQCYKIACDRKVDPRWCKPGVTVTVTATNLCPPNNALPNDNGGWCNIPRPHFDMAQPAWEKIGVYRGGIIPAGASSSMATDGGASKRCKLDRRTSTRNRPRTSTRAAPRRGGRALVLRRPGEQSRSRAFLQLQASARKRGKGDARG